MTRDTTCLDIDYGFYRELLCLHINSLGEVNG